MNKPRIALISLAVLLGALFIFDSYAFARAGGGRSSGSRGSRSYSRPASPPAQSRPAPMAQPNRPMQPPPYQAPQPVGGSFMRSMAGGIVGGMIGGMLFRSLGFGGGGGVGGGGMGGSGIGLFEILLLAGIGYFIYRFIKKKREEAALQQAGYGQNYQQTIEQPQQYGQPYAQQPYQPEPDNVEAGLAHIRQMDPSFDEARFNDQVMDMFFKIQGAWMNRDLSSANNLLTDDMRRIFQGDIDKLLQEKRINKLENIAVRNVEIVEAWQENGQDFLTTLIYANLLDYTTDDSSGQVVAGSKTDPVKFEEYWTFTRGVGNNPWRLSAIDQK